MRHGHPIQSADPSLAAKSRGTIEVVRRVARYLRPYPWMALGTIGCALVSLAASFAYPKLTRLVIDDVIGGGRRELLWPAVFGVLGAFLVRDLFNSLRIRLNNVFEQNVIFDIRRQVYGRLQRLPASWFDHRASGDLMTRVLEDVNSMERLLIDGTEQGVVALLSLIGVSVVLFVTQPTLAAVAMLPLPILIGGALWYTLTAHRRYRAQRQASAAMNALLMDNLQGIRQIKSFGREPHEDARFAERANQLRTGTLGVMKVWAIYSPAMAFAAALGTVLVLGFGGGMVLDGRLQLGQLIEFVLYLALFYEPVAKLHGLNQMLQSARAAGERVFDILDANPEESTVLTDRDAAAPAETPNIPIRGEVRYENVSFRYQADRPSLESISLHARPGEIIALVGPTGAGKTTLASLLPRYYEAGEGRISIDGTDIREFGLASLRRRISVVSQEPFLFNGTIEENLRYGRLDASQAEVEAAARAANCHEFIARLPEGYSSRVGERGVRLSVGEKQRVSIARALLKDAPILILDEATASVDTATERLIQESLSVLMRGRTSFVIAHRLSTIREADQILVLQHGRIVQQGRHEDLIQVPGLYSTLWKYQAAAAEWALAQAG